MLSVTAIKNKSPNQLSRPAIIFGHETNQQIVPAIKIVTAIKLDPTCAPNRTCT
jgi:hypothetical protein